jgi:DNA repair protein RadC
MKWGEVMKRVNFYSMKIVKEKSGLYDLDNFIVRSPEDCAQAARMFFEYEEMPSEHFCILTLNTKNKIVGAHTIFVGSLNASIVHPREVFQACLLNNAASFVALHNHPSGDPTPSREDIEVTKRLDECGRIMGIELLDHLIIGDNLRYVSLKEKGYL